MPDDVLHLFANAIQVAGLRHVSDNLLKSVMSSMSLWSPLLVQLHNMEKLLSRIQYKERLVAVCIPEHDVLARSSVSSFQAKLGGLRWEVVVDFCLQLLEVKDHMRKYWSMPKFLQGASGYGQWCLNADFEAANSAILSEIFWERVGVVAQIAFESEFIGRWASGCPCHDVTHKSKYEDQNRKATSTADFACSRKGCRAPELASGQGLQTQLRLMSQQQVVFHSHASAMGLSSTATNELHTDWIRARSRLFGQLLAKLDYWGQVPWVLCRSDSDHIISKALILAGTTFVPVNHCQDHVMRVFEPF